MDDNVREAIAFFRERHIGMEPIPSVGRHLAVLAKYFADKAMAEDVNAAVGRQADATKASLGSGNGCAMNAGTLKLLLHMYCHPPEVPFPFNGNPVHLRNCRHTLWMANLIDREDEVGIITNRGRVHVEALLAAPLPEQKWMSPL